MCFLTVPRLQKGSEYVDELTSASVFLSFSPDPEARAFLPFAINNGIVSFLYAANKMYVEET